MAIYTYSQHDERGEFKAFVTDEMGNIIWSVSYPEYYENDETGELMESSTIFDDGFMKHSQDLNGLSKYLNSLGLISSDDEIVDEHKLEEDEIRSNSGFMKSGGQIETAMKKRLNKAFELPIEMVVYVPSTESASRPISKRDFINRIEETQEFLANKFGGFSASEVEGGYISTDKGLIQEDVVKVTAFGNLDDFEKKFEELIEKIKYWADKWQQESIGFEFEGDLFYIEKNTKFSLGGENSGKAKNLDAPKIAYQGYHLPKDMYEVFVKSVSPDNEQKYLKSVVSASSFEQAEDLAMRRLNSKYPELEFEVMDIEIAEGVMESGGETKVIFENPHVSAKIGVEKNYVDILTWNPKESYQDSAFGLKDLNKKYPDKRIIAVDVDAYPSEQYAFWYKMLDEGLIYGFTDEHDRLHVHKMENGGTINYEGYYYGGGRISGKVDFGGYMAKGGVTEHGLKEGDEIILAQDNAIVVFNSKTGESAIVNIETGAREDASYLKDQIGLMKYFSRNKDKNTLFANGGKLKENVYYNLHYMLVDKKLTANGVEYVKKEVLKYGNKEQKELAKKITPPSVGKNEKLIDILTHIFYSLKNVEDKMANGGELEREINELYSKSNFINNDFNWELKLLEMLQDGSSEAYNIYQTLTKEQKEQVLQEQFEMDNDMGSYGDGNIETSKENIEILLEDARNGKKYAKGGMMYKDLSKEEPSFVTDSDVQSKKFKVDEIDLYRKGKKSFEANPKITSSVSAVKIFRQFWDEEALSISEHFNVMLLNRANKVIGVYQHSKGGVTGTVAEPKMIVLAAIKSLAKGVIIAHNHPSGNLQPSQADIDITKKIKQALKLVDIDLLDSLIISEDGFFSLADEGNMASGGMMAKGGIIASSATKAGIEQLISDYYISPNISLHKRVEGGEYDVHNKKGKINGVKVIEKRGRYQFVSDEKMEKGGKVKVDPKYTHFAVGKNDGKIVTGWEYKDVDNESIKYYTKMDLEDMDFKPSDYRILTTKYLKTQGIDPFSWDNWRKTEQMAEGGEFGVDKHRIYFRTFGEVMDAIHDIAKDNGYNIVDIFPDLSYGGVGYGQTRRAKAELEWNGEEKKGKSKKRDKNTLVINIYRMDSGSYELNTYFSYADGGMMAKGRETKWIQEAIKNKGALRETAKRKGLIKGEEKLSLTDLKKLGKGGNKTAKRAKLAETLKKLKTKS